MTTNTAPAMDSGRTCRVAVGANQRMLQDQPPDQEQQATFSGQHLLRGIPALLPCTEAGGHSRPDDW